MKLTAFAHARRLLSRLSAWVRNDSVADADVRAEMQAHLEMTITENVRRGMSGPEAHRQAMLESGGLLQASERVRAQRSLPFMEGLVADTRFAFRQIRRTPIATVTMIVVLSLGIGTNVVLFTVMNSLATLPAPGIVRDEALVRIRGFIPATGTTTIQPRLMSWPEVQQYAAQTELFSSVAAEANESALLNTGDATSQPVNVNVTYGTSNYLGVLRVRPALGNALPPEPVVTHMTTSPTAVISHALWMLKFGGSADVIGRVVRVNDVPVQIVGVAPARFIGTGGASVMTIWMPLAAYPVVQQRSTAVFSSSDSVFLTVVARLQSGVSARSTLPVVASIAARDDWRATGQTGSADVVPLLASNMRVGGERDLFLSTSASIGFALLVLMVTCTNVSALMVGLASARRREVGVRLSLGAPRLRLIRQLLTESVVLSLMAAAIGLLVTISGTRLIGAALADVQLEVNWQVTIATCAVSIVTGIIFGLSPALHATRVSLGEVLKSSSANVAATRSRLQRALVVVQIALTQPLLVGLGVVIATVNMDASRSTLSRVPGQIAELEVDTWAAQISNAEREARVGLLVERVAAIPGVTAVMPRQLGTVTVPLTVYAADRIPGVTPEGVMVSQLTSAPKGYFSAFEIPMVRGREFDSGELVPLSNDPLRPASYPSVIIGSDLAKRLWGNANPIGRRLVMPSAQASQSGAMTIVGVVDAAVAGPSVVNDQVRVYVPWAAMNSGITVRTSGAAMPMLNAMRKLVAAEVPQMPIVRAETMEQREAGIRRNVRRTSSAVAGGGVLALLLSAIGLYAVVSLAVGQRTREIGIRTALGARRGQVVRMFFVNGLALSALGLVLGLPLSIIVTRVIVTNLNWPLPNSPLLGVAIGAAVLVVASVAVWIPARRASTIDPIIALRTE